MKNGSRTNMLHDPPPLSSCAHVHLMGICGTGMASLAGLFHESGFRVTGSDQGVYPPMSDLLKELGIDVMNGYRASNLEERPDLVVVGNVIRRTNPEAVELEKSGIPFTTLPAALHRYFSANRTRIVVAGTHGKTTVSTMISWILHHEGLDPGFMIGGLPLNFERSYRLGTGDYFIIEGDEYDTAYFEKSPKFLHYYPHIGIITSCEFDHGDIYDSLDQIREQFQAFVQLIPSNGCLVANGDDETVRQIVDRVNPRCERYGFGGSLNWTVQGAEDTGRGMIATVRRDAQEVALGTLPVVGFHNLLNVLAAIAVVEKVGIDPQKALDALASYRGVKRRQEVLAEEAGIVLMEDFAHHPTAVKLTCEGVRSRYPGRRLVAVFEPRTNTSRRAFFQSDYVPAFLAADLIILREPQNLQSIVPADRFSSKKLATDLRAFGKDARAFGDTEQIVEFLSGSLEAGDVVLIMSTGSFDNLGALVATALKEREK